jgi:Protein of unknown function (DUF2637)
MTTTTAPPPGAPPPPLVNGHRVMPQSDYQDTHSTVPQSAPTDPGPRPAGPLGGGWVAVIVTVGIMAALVALGGMVLSFRAVSGEMAPAFGARWAWLVPIVVDLTVFVFSGVDLVLARLDMSHPLARVTVYGATFGTVYLNYSAGATMPGRIAHVLMPSIWVVFIELMRHVVRRQVNLATASQRESIPVSRWIVSPWPTLKLWRRMVLWRVNSYPTALAMERTRLGALAAARQIHGRTWRYRISPLVRLQIGLGEIDADTVAALLTGAPGHDTDSAPATGADTARPTHGQANGQNPATTRPRSGQDTAAKVARYAAKHPEMTTAVMAEKLALSVRTVRRYRKATA